MFCYAEQIGQKKLFVSLKSKIVFSEEKQQSGQEKVGH